MNRELPGWLSGAEYGQLPVVHTGWWRRTGYLEKTLADIQQIMAEDMYQSAIAARTGVLQRVEPRVKLIGTGILLLAVALSPSLAALAAVHFLLAGVAVLSGVEIDKYIKRVWIPALLFAGLAALPGTLSWVTPGDAVVVFYQGTGGYHIGSFFLPEQLSVTRQGLMSAAFILLRAAASLGLVTLLVQTTRWPVLTKAIGGLGLPSVFVMVLDLTYRYLFLFLLLLTEYILGRKSRLVAVETPQGKLVWIGGALAGFFRMLWQYSGEITAAMQARGYTGVNHQSSPLRLDILDVCFLSIVVLVAISVWGGSCFAGNLNF
ncbi:MAG: energy-coupling factor transporter transmembrane component T [Veillonellales bacterium]